MNLVFLDLEMNQPSNAIIQIGAVVGNIKTGVLVETLSVYINAGEVLNPEIIQLTGITQEMVDQGVSLMDGYKQLCALQARTEAEMNLLTWGGADGFFLRDQLGKVEDWPFGRRYDDVKTLFIAHQRANGLPYVGGLTKSMRRLGLKFDGQAHNAIYDALNTFLIYQELLKRLRRPELTV